MNSKTTKNSARQGSHGSKADGPGEKKTTLKQVQPAISDRKDGTKGPSALKTASSKPETKGPCKQFFLKGACRYGSKCYYSHSLPKISMVTEKQHAKPVEEVKIALPKPTVKAQDWTELKLEAPEVLKKV